MIYAVNCAVLSAALEKLGKLVKENEQKGIKTVVFCEDRLSLAAERAVCTAVNGTFLTSVYTFSRYLSSHGDRSAKVLSSQGSAMVIRRIIEENRTKLKLFKKLSSTGAAQAVYDTIALLYSSRVSAQDISLAAEKGGRLSEKLADLALIYTEYSRYIEENGWEDRNNYLKKLPPLIENAADIKGNCIIFLGFQALTCVAAECVRAAFRSAREVWGLFIGGKQDLYVNEASATYITAANEFGGAVFSEENGNMNPAAQAFRQALFNPESFYKPKTAVDNVHVYEAADGTEELEFIAACIKRQVNKGTRYAKISVMLPDVENSERELARVFSQYKIPYYADRRYSLAEHPLCSFLLSFLSCVSSGCRADDVDEIISSPFFPADQSDKDIFRNYALRCANFRGGVKREPDEEICVSCGYDFASVKAVRELFLKGYNLLSDSVNSSIVGGVRTIFELYGVKDKVDELGQTFADEYPSEAKFGARAYDGVFTVLEEAQTLAAGAGLRDLIKIIKSGFAAMKISLIPPKADAVFVGDLSATANTGSDLVFAARLTSDVPACGTDAALLTDRDIALLEEINVNVSPKIRQVNARNRETAALNVCAFRQRLFLTYPARLNGEESVASEIVRYAYAAFCTPDGNKMKPVPVAKLKNVEKFRAWYCSEKITAIKELASGALAPESASAVYALLNERGFGEAADAAITPVERKSLTCGGMLYLNNGSLSPSALESYFSCPYRAFTGYGLRAKEREESSMGAVDSGNFIHSVLEDIAREANDISSDERLKERAAEIARIKLKKPPYSALLNSRSGEYSAQKLVEEAVTVSAGMYEQLKNSRFSVREAECACRVELTGGVQVYGRIDRVDDCGDMVRVIDYKTGTIDASPTTYYSGGKLQLPLYLLSVSKGKRAVGAYYFPASVTYKEKRDGSAFRLQGFMDGSEEVVSASDTLVETGKKSDYFDAYLNGRKLDSAMDSQDFADFLNYSRLVAGKGAQEMISGNVAPSPVVGACEWCKAGGSCGFSAGRDGEARKIDYSVKCADIAKIVKKERGDV